jgi:hypothetical protein
MSIFGRQAFTLNHEPYTRAGYLSISMPGTVHMREAAGDDVSVLDKQPRKFRYNFESIGLRKPQVLTDTRLRDVFRAQWLKEVGQSQYHD